MINLDALELNLNLGEEENNSLVENSWIIGFLQFPQDSKVETWRVKIVRIVNRKREVTGRDEQKCQPHSLHPILWDQVYT